MATPTVTGLTFTPLATALAGSNNAWVGIWGATAASGGSGSITATHAGGIITGCLVHQFRGSDGFGTPASITGTTGKTINVTRGGANSHVATFFVDWNAVNDVAVDATPTGTVRLASFQTGQASFFSTSHGDQGAAGGPTAYGITNHTDTVDMSGFAVEVLGTAGGGGPDVTQFYKRRR